MPSLLKDRRIQIALAIAVFEWVFFGGLAVVAGNNNPLLLGGVLLVATWFQLGALFWRRRPSGLLPDAQEAFMQGDYVTAADKLETMLVKGNSSLKVKTLLGNVYRQMARFDDSEAILREVLREHPKADFPLYGLGRTLLAKGDYLAAAETIQAALDNGGRKTIQNELALAQYFAGEKADALKTAKRAVRNLQLEAHRVLTTNYLLKKLEDDPRALPMIERAKKGKTYWQLEIDRFDGHSDYANQLSLILEDVHRWLETEEA